MPQLGISGSTEAEAVIRITVDDGTESAIFTTTADGVGSWTLTLGDVQGQLQIDHAEELTVNVSATDRVNNVTTLPTEIWTVDAVVAPIDLEIDDEDRDPDPASGAFSINASAGISGSTEAHSVIRVTVDDGAESAIFTTTADAAGSWTLDAWRCSGATDD